nr:MAG TPA: KaiB domain [Caudoviricetes sp.]
MVITSFRPGLCFVPPLDTMYYSTSCATCQHFFKIFRKFFCNFLAFCLHSTTVRIAYTIISRRWCGVYPLQP